MSEANRVAALYDVHGNVFALDAVLSEVERDGVDAIVFGGDLAGGPFPQETLERAMSVRDRARYVQGNGDRELLAALDASVRFDPRSREPWESATAWAAERMPRRLHEFVAAFESTVTLDVEGLGPVLFCHGTPRSDEEIVTRLTPETELAAILSDVREQTVVLGHTHVQFERVVAGRRLVNAGSVGMPYEGVPGAYWALLGPGVSLRRTEYDLERAAAAVSRTGFPVPGFAEENVLASPQREGAEAHFERLAARQRSG